MNNIEVALAKEACLACGKLMDGPIIMNTRLTKKEAEKVKEIHNKCIGYADKLCQKCEELASQGLLCIEIDESKSEPNNPYRTGFIFVLREESDLAKYFRSMPKFIIRKGNSDFVFLTTEVVDKLQIPRSNTSENFE